MTLREQAEVRLVEQREAIDLLMDELYAEIETFRKKDTLNSQELDANAGRFGFVIPTYSVVVSRD